jgi:hypothetical protein
VSVPPGPDFHQFANRKSAEELLLSAGFSDIGFSIINCAWDLNAPEELSEIYERGTVRAAAMLASQPPQNLAAIRIAMAQSVQRQFADGARWRVPVPAALVHGTT